MQSPQRVPFEQVTHELHPKRAARWKGDQRRGASLRSLPHATDHWRCCYCGRFLINTRVLEYIALLAGNDVCPYVNDHYPGPQETTDPATWITHPAIRRHAVQVEQVRPRSREPDTNRPDNLR